MGLASTIVLASMVLLQQPKTAAPAIEAPASHYAEHNTHKVHYVDSAPASGAGEALVLIHGWASDWTFLEPQFEDLQDHARVIAIDLPGHGKSDAPKIQYSMDYFADAIAAVLDEAKVEHAVLVGHSNGVPTIRQFYRRHKERTLALVCLDGALFNVFPAAMAEPVKEMLRADSYKDTIDAMLTGMLGTSSLEDEAKAHIRKVMLATPQHVLLGGMEAGIDENIWIEDTIDVPTLIINAPNPMWSREYLVKLESLGPDITVRNWEGVSHMLMMEERKKMEAEVTAFLRSHELLD